MTQSASMRTAISALVIARARLSAAAWRPFGPVRTSPCAQLDTDLANLIGTRIVAAQAGTVVAVNGEPGELVGSLGIRDYSSDSGAAAVGVQPEFSLLPKDRSQASRPPAPRASCRLLPSACPTAGRSSSWSRRDQFRRSRLARR
jgi:hypothetical protein